jgi:hypothetical protein
MYDGRTVLAMLVQSSMGMAYHFSSSEQCVMVKPDPFGIVMGAYGTPAYLSLTYFRNNKTRT